MARKRPNFDKVLGQGVDALAAALRALIAAGIQDGNPKRKVLEDAFSTAHEFRQTHRPAGRAQLVPVKGALGQAVTTARGLSLTVDGLEEAYQACIAALAT